MSQLGVLIVIVLYLFSHVRAQDKSDSDRGFQHPLRPNMAIIIGIPSIVFSLLLLVLGYAKFCQTNPFEVISRNDHPQNFHQIIQSRSRSSSGLDKAVIEALPFFRFSSLKGSKEGLECIVCISRFEDSDILRLLPKCRHAFHVTCIDQWLESHSSCPICRYKFDIRDLRSFSYSNSLRFSGNPTNLREDPNLELFVQRELEHQSLSSRFNIGSSFRRTDKGKKEELLVQDINRSSSGDKKLLHKFKHRIIISDVVIRNRWSDVNASDLLFLNSEMVRVMSSDRISRSNSTSGRFQNVFPTNDHLVKIKEDMEMKRLFDSKFGGIHKSNSVSASSSALRSISYDEANSSKVLKATEKRSMSEIINFSRFRDLSLRQKFKEATLEANGGKEERLRRLWLPMVQRTLQLFAGGERNLQEIEKKRKSLNV